jgi:fatty-acid peroxygenase
MFVDVLSPAAVQDLAVRATGQWSAAAAGWADGDPVVVFTEAARVLTGAVLPWAGVPVDRAEVTLRARQLVEVVDGFATPVVPYVRAATSRRQLNRWATGLVSRVRSGVLHPEPGTALHAAATFRGRSGRLLSAHVAAVELLNFVRPTVAVAWYVAFAADALRNHPQWATRIVAGDERTLYAVAQEVRRLYPFVPVLAARARHRQDVLGIDLRRGGLVVLDVHGTNHDPTSWPDPDQFKPERFLTGAVDPDALVPQGGGDVRLGHRCPGEDVTLTMLAVALRCLAGHPEVVASQDLHWDLSRMPSRPALRRRREVGRRQPSSPVAS